ncbi:MAG TPA: CAP domain-containing protein [Candidatus Limnocylindria bacterium]|nr:CAP domain-containing protein [Candidatus Limnocylindria bacterium]
MRTLLVCLTLAVSSVVFAAPSSAAAATSDDMLYLTNQMRYAIGAPTLTADSRVVGAAQNHANYNSANNILGHFETAGLPYYTGYSARDRVAAMGWSTSFVSEVATGGSDPLVGVRQLWDAPYHRLGLMHPSASTLGWGHSDIGGRGSTVGDIAYNFGLRPVEFVRSPAHRQTNIPTSWSGNESPNPLPAGASRPVGYPIMVVYSGGKSVVMRGAEVVAPDGTRLPIYYAPQQFEYDYQVIIPQRPLAPNTTYHVRFDITVAGTWLTNEWDFSTGATISSGGGGGAPPSASDNGLHSAWVDQTAVPAMQPAATQSVTLRFRNSGTKTWMKGVAGSQIALGISGDNTTFSGLGMSVGWPSANRVAIQNESAVAPGGIASFTFAIKAPLSGGLVNIPVRPVVDGVAWLEDQGVVVPVVTTVDYHSRWLTQSPYPTLRAGQVSGQLSISFLNTGGQSWTKGLLGQEARLGVNRDNETWAGLGVGWPSANRVAFQNEPSVPPGAVGTFVFQVRAPLTPGTYAINLRPVIDGVTWMEDQGVFLYVTVVP